MLDKNRNVHSILSLGLIVLVKGWRNLIELYYKVSVVFNLIQQHRDATCLIIRRLTVKKAKSIFSKEGTAYVVSDNATAYPF